MENKLLNRLLNIIDSPDAPVISELSPRLDIVDDYYMRIHAILMEYKEEKEIKENDINTLEEINKVFLEFSGFPYRRI